MNQTSTRLDITQDDGRREALTWLARRLKWEERLGELRPAPSIRTRTESRQAA